MMQHPAARPRDGTTRPREVVAGPGGQARGLAGEAQALKLEPQPQVLFAVGFENLNPAPWRPST